MRGLRLKFMLWLYNWSSRLYATLFKHRKVAWGITKEEFLAYPDGTLGNALGEFYRIKKFDVMPKLENHDVFHLITSTETNIEDEIAMQYLLLGNGKFSIYLMAMILIGGVLFPEYIQYYSRSYKKGKQMWEFHHLEFKNYLNEPLLQLQNTLEFRSNLLILKY